MTRATTRLAACLTLFLLATIPTLAFNTIDVAARLGRSTVLLTTSAHEGFCSGFVIDTKRDYVMTADHCVDFRHEQLAEGIWIDGIQATPTASVPDLDVAVLQVTGLDRPALKPRHATLRVGIQVMSAGFGWGTPNNQRRMGILSNLASTIPDHRFPGTWLEFDFDAAGGNSGGPIVDDDARVVSVVQLGYKGFGATWGKSIADVWPVTWEYWQR